jgi:hypothetical protein
MKRETETVAELYRYMKEEVAATDEIEIKSLDSSTWRLSSGTTIHFVDGEADFLKENSTTVFKLDSLETSLKANQINASSVTGTE